MKRRDAENLVFGVSFEDAKTNLMLAGADYKIKPYGKGEIILVKCEDGSFRVSRTRGGDGCIVSRIGSLGMGNL